MTFVFRWSNFCFFFLFGDPVRNEEFFCRWNGVLRDDGVLAKKYFHVMQPAPVLFEYFSPSLLRFYSYGLHGWMHSACRGIIVWSWDFSRIRSTVRHVRSWKTLTWMMSWVNSVKAAVNRERMTNSIKWRWVTWFGNVFARWGEDLLKHSEFIQFNQTDLDYIICFVQLIDWLIDWLYQSIWFSVDWLID